jgi:hypothetical protein
MLEQTLDALDAILPSWSGRSGPALRRRASLSNAVPVTVTRSDSAKFRRTQRHAMNRDSDGRGGGRSAGRPSGLPEHCTD